MKILSVLILGLLIGCASASKRATRMMNKLEKMTASESKKKMETLKKLEALVNKKILSKEQVRYLRQKIEKYSSELNDQEEIRNRVETLKRFSN